MLACAVLCHSGVREKERACGVFLNGSGEAVGRESRLSRREPPRSKGGRSGELLVPCDDFIPRGMNNETVGSVVGRELATKLGGVVDGAVAVRIVCGLGHVSGAAAGGAGGPRGVTSTAPGKQALPRARVVGELSKGKGGRGSVGGEVDLGAGSDAR